MLTEQDKILLADFGNSTEDSIFDGTLKQGLAVQLGQSPFLDLFPDIRVRQTLRLMGRSPDDRVTAEIGQEICQRRAKGTCEQAIQKKLDTIALHYFLYQWVGEV